MTDFIDYLIRKELTSKTPNSPFRTKSPNSHLKLIPQALTSKKHIKLINLKAIQITSPQITQSLQNNSIDQYIYDSQIPKYQVKTKILYKKSFSNHKDKYIIHFCPEYDSLPDSIKRFKRSDTLAQTFTQKQTKSKLSFKNLGKLNEKLSKLRKISPFQKDLRKINSQRINHRKSTSNQLKYTIETIYQIPLKDQQNTNLKHEQSTIQKNNIKGSREVKKGYQNQIESENNNHAYLYMASETKDFKFCVRCYFADQNHQRIRIKDQYVRNQIIYEQLGTKNTSDFKDFNESSIFRSKKMNSQVNPLTGQVYLEFTFLSLSQEIKLSELLDDCQTYLSGKSQQISHLISQIQKFQLKETSILELQKKKQGVLDECKVLLKANLFQSEHWINTNITPWKQIQRKLENELLMAYTFPNKVPEYEIMEDPFLKDYQKTYAINQLREKEAKTLQIFRQQQKLRQNQIEFLLVNSKIPEVSKYLGGVFLSIKKSLQQVNAQIEKCRNSNDAKERNSMLRVESENRKRCHSVIVPLNSNKARDESVQKLNLETSFNSESIAQEFKRLKTSRQSLLKDEGGSPNYESIVKLRTVGEQTFYSIKLVSISELQVQMQVEKILSKCTSNRSNSHKPLSLSFYLFEYRNIEAYSKWFCEEKMQKSQLINPFLSSQFSFPSKEFFISSNQFNNAVNGHPSSDFINNIRTLANPNSMPDINHHKTLNVKSKQGSCSKISQNGDSLKYQLPKNLVYNKSYPCDIPSSGSLYWDKKYAKNIQKINIMQLPDKFVYENKYIFSIRVASRVIKLREFLERNRTSLRFGKKVHIYKQIVEFYYILEYNGIDKEVRFCFEDIFICKNLNVKIDLRLDGENQFNVKQSSMYQILLEIFFHIFLDGQYISNPKSPKLPLNHRNSSDSNHLTIQQQKLQQESFSIKQFELQQANFQQLLQENDQDMRVRYIQRVYEKFGQFRYLRQYGDVTFLKYFFTMLKRYCEISPSENQQIFKGEPTSVWLFLLIRKLHDYLQL